jgi:tetratricopeptide (TPR) repeat protein
MVGWLWYLGTLVPVIGLVQVGEQAMADRYTYLPLIGIYILVTWGIAALAEGRLKPGLLLPPALAILLLLSLTARSQTSHWKDSRSLYVRALETTSRNWIIQYNYGMLLEESGEIDEAMAHYREALRIHPTDVESALNLSSLMLLRGDFTGAVRTLEAAWRSNPADPRPAYNLGLAHAERNLLRAAEKWYRESLGIREAYFEAHNNLGIVLMRRGSLEEALKHYTRAGDLEPESEIVQTNIADAYRVLGREKEALEHYRRALEINPGYRPAREGMQRLPADR